MSRRLRWAIFCSLSIHLALLAMYMHRRVLAPLEKTVVQVEFLTRSAPASGSSSTGRHSTSRRKGGIKLGDLIPRLAINSKALRGENFTDMGDDDGNGRWGSHGNQLSELAHFTQYDRLFREIEGLLNYPFRLGEHGISGTINTRLTFDADSHCDWSHSRVDGAHPYLRYYTLSLLKKLCAFATIEHLHFVAGQFVDLSFAFLVVDEANARASKFTNDRINGNVLSFFREYRTSVLDYHIGPLRGLLLVPAVALDPQWLVEHWEKWIEHKDPLREFQGH